MPLGRHIVVEDSHAGGNPVTTRVARGPRPAIKRFLAENDAFVVDESMHKFFFTFNPGGYLKRVALELARGRDRVKGSSALSVVLVER